MAEGVARVLSNWTPFYAGLGGIAATLLGLLFVAVSLRLNLFHNATVIDVRDFAALDFGQYLALVLLGLVALLPAAPLSVLGGSMGAMRVPALPWAAAAELGTLLVASLGAWVLLSHAQGS